MTIFLSASLKPKDSGAQFNVDKFELWRTLVVPVESDSEVQFVFHQQRHILDSTAGFFGLRQIGGETLLIYRWLSIGEERQCKPVRHLYFPAAAGISLYQVNLRTMRAKLMAKTPDGSVSRDWIVGAGR